MAVYVAHLDELQGIVASEASGDQLRVVEFVSAYFAAVSRIGYAVSDGQAAVLGLVGDGERQDTGQGVKPWTAVGRESCQQSLREINHTTALGKGLATVFDVLAHGPEGVLGAGQCLDVFLGVASGQVEVVGVGR